MRSLPTVGLAMLAFGAGMMVSGRPVRAQEEANSAIQTVAVSRIAEWTDATLWVVKGGVVYRCHRDRQLGEPSKPYTCEREALNFQ